MHNRYRLTLLILITLLLAGCGAERNMKKGEQFLVIGEYHDAANQFKMAYRKTPPKERDTRGQRAKRMALCYDRQNATPQAIAAYRNVIRYRQDDIMTHLALARQLLRHGDYKQAADEYQLVLDSMPDKPWPARDCSRHSVPVDGKRRAAGTR